MAIDAERRESPGWWLAYLANKLRDRQQRLGALDAYFRGDPPLPQGAENQREAYQAFQRSARSNFAELVVEATRERMVPLGVRTGAADDGRGSAVGDETVWEWWRENELDVESAEVHTGFLSLGDAYVIVGVADGRPTITAESPLQVVTVHDPVRQRRVRAGAKFFHDDIAGKSFAFLYLPGRRFVASLDLSESSVSAAGANRQIAFDTTSWDWDADLGGEAGEPVPGDVASVVRFRNKRGIGEYEPHLDLLNRINHMLLQRMMIATLQAFRQRAVIVDPQDMPETDDEGKKIDYDDIFSADPGAMWRLPMGAQMWESGQVDLTPILSSVKDDVQHLAAVTRTPLHYFTPDAANGSAEGASLMREGLVAKTRDRIKRVGPAWEQALSIAATFMGDEARADLRRMRVLWANPEQFSLAERFAAAAQAGPAGVPWEGVMTDVLQLPPETVDQYRAWRIEDEMLNPVVLQSRNEPGTVGAR